MTNITADELPRFMACNGSHKMEAATPPSVDIDSTARDEGIAAHYMAKEVFEGRTTVDKLVDQKAPNGFYMTAEMADHVAGYLDNIISNVPRTVGMEINTSHNGSNWRVGGRADYALQDFDYSLRIVDFKYGYRIVEPYMNWTLISHVIGFIGNNTHVQPQVIHLDVYQPRPHHADGPLRRWTINWRQMCDLYAQLDAALTNPSDALNTSNHCNKCRALATCPAARRAEANAIDMSTSLFTDKIDNKNLSFTLDNLDRAIKMLEDRQSAFKELALHRIQSGQVVENYATEQSLSNARWKPGYNVDMLKIMTGVDLSKPGVVTPAEAKRRGVDKVTVDKIFSERVPTGTKLKRIDPDKAARKAFGDGT